MTQTDFDPFIAYTYDAVGNWASKTVNPRTITVTAANQPPTVYYIVPDHLDTPRFIADDTQKIVWSWDQQEPFGATPPNDDPDADGVKFDFPLRFPGQYFDRETSLAYNRYRDYDPAIGRFVEPDPLGLIDGPSLFAFVRLNPLIFADPTGRSVWDWFKKKGTEKGLAGGIGGQLGGQCAEKACKKNWGQPATEDDATQICADLMSDNGLTYQLNYDDIFFTCKDTCKNLSNNCKCLEKPKECACL